MPAAQLGRHQEFHLLPKNLRYFLRLLGWIRQQAGEQCVTFCLREVRSQPFEVELGHFHLGGGGGGKTAVAGPYMAASFPASLTAA